MKNKLIYLLLFLCSCLTTALVANDTLYYQPNKVFENDELVDLNDIYSHSDGYLYFIYDNKIEKYDGRNLENITVLDQNFDSFLRAKSFNGTIFIYDFLGQLFYIQSDTLKPYKYNSIIKEFNPYRKTIDFYFDEKESLHISSATSYIIIDSNGKVSFPLKDNGIISSGYYAVLRENGIPFFAGNNNTSRSSIKDTLYLLNNDFEILSKIKINIKSEAQPFAYAYDSKGDFFFSSGKGGITYYKNKRLYNLELGVKNINRVFINEGLLWVSTQHEGIFSFDLVSNELVSKINVEKALIATSDFQGNLWMYQTKGGVYKLDYRKPINYSKSFAYPKIEGKSMVYTNQNKVYIYLKNRVIQFRNDNFMSEPNQISGSGTYPVFDNFCMDERGGKWFSKRGAIYHQAEDKNARKIEIPNPILSFHPKFRTYLFRVKDKVWGTHHTYFFELDSAKVGSFYKNESEDDIIYLGEYKDSLLIATASSIRLRPLKNLLSSESKVIWNGKNKRINPASFKIDNDNIYFQFFSEDYSKYSEGKIIQLRILNESKNSYYSQSTYKGNWYVIGKDWLICVRDDKILSRIHTLTSKTIKKFFFADDHFYWLEKEDIRGVQINSLVKKPKALKLIMPKLSYRGVEYLEKTQVPHDYDYLKINLKAISFNSDQVYYRYRLKNNLDWFKTNNSEVILSALSSGNYNFSFEASEDGFDWIKGDDISIKVEFPFWKKGWFILFVCLLLLTVTTVYFKFRLNRIREINELELNQLNLEQRILKTQMNPHYLFNVISSLKYLIIERDFTKANLFLSLFSKNLRSTLNYSSKKLVTIEEEIQFLKKYLSVESFRNQEQFNWEVELAKDLNLELIIPPFLIQPVVENAIKYGLNESNLEQSVKINFDLDKDYLIVTVLDNGLGFKKDFKIVTNPEEASALSILNERLVKHNQSNKRNIVISKDKLTGMNLVSIKIRIQA